MAGSMSEGFNNPVINAAGDLIKQQIQSPNFVPGASGWRIAKDGTAQFSNVEALGTVSVIDPVWTFANDFAGAPANNFTVPTADVSQITVGDTFQIYRANGPLKESTTFTVLSIGSDFFGNTAVTFTPAAQSSLNVGDVVTQTNTTTLGGIDQNGNVTGQTIAATTDVLIGGASLENDILPTFAQGFVNRGWVNMSGASWPTTPIGATETSLFELDVLVPAGRSYMIILSPFRIQCSLATGSVVMNIHYTTDGSTPTTASNIFFGSAFPAASAVMSPEWTGFYNNTSGADTVLSMLVSVSVSTGTMQFHPSGGNVNTLGIDVLDVGDITAAQAGNNATQFGTGSGGGASKQNFNKSYAAANTWAYEGSNGDQPLQQINHNGNAYQGDDGLGDNGNTSTFIQWPSQVATDLSGATINSVTITLNNNHSWFNSGMTWNLGVTTASPGGGSRPAITNPNIAQLNTSEGAVHSYKISNVSSAFAAALAAGNAFVLFNPTATRNSYGYAAGAGQGNPPKITVNFTK